MMPLTRAEFNLLAALARAPNRVLSRSFLLDAVSQDSDAPTDRLIDVLVSRVRKKIEADPKRPRIIATVVGSGYKFAAEVE
jgi:DNA-binding response OmpR family regulator